MTTSSEQFICVREIHTSLKKSLLRFFKITTTGPLNTFMIGIVCKILKDEIKAQDVMLDAFF